MFELQQWVGQIYLILHQNNIEVPPKRKVQSGKLEDIDRTPHHRHKKNQEKNEQRRRTCDLVLGALDEGLLLPEELVEDAAAGAEGLPLRDRVVVPHRAHRHRRRAPPGRGRGAGGDARRRRRRRRRRHQRTECGGSGRHHCAHLLAVNTVVFG